MSVWTVDELLLEIQETKTAIRVTRLGGHTSGDTSTTPPSLAQLRQHLAELERELNRLRGKSGVVSVPGRVARG